MSYQLEELIKDNSLQKKLKQVRESAKTYLERINRIFPEYTPHDISHKYKVIENLSKLIPIRLAQKMNQYEILFLLCVAYVHDIGMCRLEKLGDSEQLTDSEKDNLRRTI
jgi:HD-GYP domain-containing protein (c-di-GMP phosphodiesterase class II)